MAAEVGHEEEDEDEACPTMLRLSFTFEPGIAGQPCGKIGVVYLVLSSPVDQGLINKFVPPPFLFCHAVQGGG